ncbi:MAG TPA: DUF3089 domain-containing protein, partial [Sphingobium sp.]|nr:DUF3089 domain-containing protein [Sphingobium sp.]
MCARRFLMLIFILILITVGGAFALYQWGGDVLVRMATPVGHYVEPPKGSGPDYSRAESWIARPDFKDNPAKWQPGEAKAFVTDKLPTATFYLHPTTYLQRDRWNAPMDADGEPALRARLFVQSQASAFNSFSDIWAPKYRQAAYGAFLLNSDDARKALDLAYRDVLAAFDVFLAAQPKEEAIVLAAHSQGSLHLLRMLADRKEALKGRRFIAYVVGWPVGIRSDLPATGLQPCVTPVQSGCVQSWQSFKEPDNTNLVTDAWVGTPGLTGAARTRDDMMCTNPLTGTKDGTAPPAANRGTLVPDGDLSNASLEPGRVGARCKGGFLLIDGDVPNLGPYVLPGNNYHVYDYALFWGSIR